jgi:cell filamentation protein
MLLAERAGHPLQLGRLEPKIFLDATIAGFGGDEAPLAGLIHDLVR